MIIRRRKPYSSGLYVKGAIGSVPVVFTADTGATKTIISDRVYNKLDPAYRPTLIKTSCLVGAGGTPINEKGKAIFDIQIGPVSLQKEIIVAEIEDECLLGIDILQNDDGGPADLLLTKGVIVLKGQEIPCIQIGLKSEIRKVRAADHYTIPGYSEAVIDVMVDRSEADDSCVRAHYIIEPTAYFKETYPLQMASVLVDVNANPTCKIRLLNPFPNAAFVNQDAVLGQAEEIGVLKGVIKREENPAESNNNTYIRRVTVSKETEIKSVGETSDKSQPDIEIKDIPEHLRDLFLKSIKGRSHEEQQAIANILIKFKDTFSINDLDLGLTHLNEHTIDTGDAKPVKQPPRRVPLAFAEQEKKAVEELLAKGVIRKSTSPWASPIVLVKKKNGQIRPCVDYRRVNQLVKPDGFPLPRIQDCLDAVAGSTLFSTFDLTSGFFQIPLKTEDVPKSAFVCKYGQFEMLRMPFGLNNSSNTFQRTMELALQGLQWETCIIYIDDVIVYGKTFKDHMERVQEVLERLQAAGLKLKPEKCELLQKEVVFLGHVVSGEGISPNPVNIAKIMEWPAPTNVKQVRQFVAMGSYYRRFVQDFAKMARPMLDLTKKGKKFIWDEKCEESFQNLKKALVSPDVMGYPLHEGGDFILDVDASDVGLGGILQQVQGGRERVIAYASRALNKAERNYCITEKELLAVRYFVEYFRQYLLGRRFLVRSDHQALVWLFKLKEPRGKIARWIEIMSQYDFSIEYRAGKKQGHCDALSRCENPKDCDCAEFDMDEPLKCGPCKKCTKRAQDMSWQGGPIAEEMLTPPPIKQDPAEKVRVTSEDPNNVPSTSQGTGEVEPDCSPHGKTGNVLDSTSQDEDSNKPSKTLSWSSNRSQADLRELQEQDTDIGPILKAKTNDRRPRSEEVLALSPASRHYWVVWESLVIKDGLLCKTFVKQNLTGNHIQFVVPQKMRRDVMLENHDSVISGHLGCKKTLEKIRQRYYWYAMKGEVDLHLKQCDVCAADKKPNKLPRAPMGTIVTGAPLDVIATDYMGPFPVTEQGNRYVLVLTDHFSKYVEVLAVPDQTAETCASKILNEFICRWGCPLSIHSDQGRNYESRVFKELCRMLEIRKTRTSPRNPRGNGQTERFNRTLIRMIKAYLCDEQDQWDRNLGCLAGAYRATPNESTGLTPNLLTMGREVRLPSELVFGSSTVLDGQEVTSYGDYVNVLRSRLQRAHQVAREHLAIAAKRNKTMYDAKIAVNKYKAGDIVWCLAESRKVGVAPKLVRSYEGPYLVKQKVAEVNFILQTDKKVGQKLVHHNKLKPYEGTHPPKWILSAQKKISC